MKADRRFRGQDGPNARTLVFQWKGLDGSSFPKWLAVGIVGASFSFCLGAIRVQIVRPTPWIEKKASLIYLAPGVEGRRWALQAQEGGPFPSRFEPRDWSEAASMEEVLRATTKTAVTPHVPALRDLPDEEGVPRIPLSTPGQPVFPERKPTRGSSSNAGIRRLAPVLYPLSGLTLEDMPTELPTFQTPPEGAPTAVPWRFLIRLHPDGSVAESVSLVGPGAPGLESVEQWLRAVNFPPAPDAEARWVSVGIGFANQSIHGPDAR